MTGPDPRPGPDRGLTAAYSRAVNAFSATAAGSWVVKHLAAKVDPWIFRRTGGRATITGIPTLPLLTLVTTGRRSGKLRAVQLATVDEGGTWLVVASAMGQDHDPDWLLNLRADPRCRLVLRGREVEATAAELDPDAKAAVWPVVCRVVPQMRTYERRTRRDIPVMRLTAL